MGVCVLEPSEENVNKHGRHPHPLADLCELREAAARREKRSGSSTPASPRLAATPRGPRRRLSPDPRMTFAARGVCLSAFSLVDRVGSEEKCLLVAGSTHFA